jgi:hypothetical protein
MSANALNAKLRLMTASGKEVVARYVLYGERFGPGGRYVNNGRPLVEFRRADVSPSIAYLNSFQLDLFATIPLDVRFSPDGTLPNALPLAEVQRLVDWVEAHRAAADDDPEGDELI